MTRRTVMVTGAAAGIGREIALRFAAEGWRVGAYDVDQVGLAALGRELGEGHVTGTLDVRDAEAWRTALDDLTGPTNGMLDALVNNAGILSSGRFDSIPLDAQQRIIDVNVTGVLNGCHTAYQHLKATPGAQLLNLCSASAVYGQAELAAYSASKFAVRGLTEALDQEWSGDDIRVTALWPLFVATGMVDGMDIASTRSLGVRLTARDVATEAYAAVTAKRRLGGVHHAVGRQARLMLASAEITPSWMLRLVNRRIASH